MLNKKGISLIILVFAMMVLAVLGWSLAVLQSGDFEVSVRQNDSEQALYLAESGINWALEQLSEDASWRTDSTWPGPDDDCDVERNG